MKKIIQTVSTAFIMCAFSVSCSNLKDDLSSYFETELLDKYDAENSYAGQFKAIWVGMDCSYPHWDYEAKYGLDWDDVYDKYLPLFQEIDRKRSSSSLDKDSLKKEVAKLYSDIFLPLHDGHLDIKIHGIGSFDPYILRLGGYLPDSDRLVDWDWEQIDLYMKVRGYSYPRIDTLETYRNIISEVSTSKTHIDSVGMCCHIDNSVAYYRPPMSLRNFQGEVREIWEKWFEMIHELNEEKKLKGIIIDLRGFKGGDANCYHYLIGFLQPKSSEYNGHHQTGWIRYKNGVGRFEYTPFIPLLAKYDDSYKLEGVNVPTVVLSSTTTASLGEIACLGIKELKNGCLIGIKTHGGLSPINTRVGSHSNVGSKKGSFYISQMPQGTFLTKNFEFLEGIGVSPDIEQTFDEDLFEETGHDSQLDRALEYIRTGK